MVRELALPWLREHVESLAALPPAGDDGDRPIGQFIRSDERGRWASGKVGDGMVRARPAPELPWIFR
jgi:hypothetical protein